MGSGHQRELYRRVEGAGAEEGARVVEVGGEALGRGSRARAFAARSGPAAKRCADARGVLAAVRRWVRASESAQGKRIESKESHFRTHLVGSLGDKQLDRIGDEDVQQLKTVIDGSGKTVNNVLGRPRNSVSIGLLRCVRTVARAACCRARSSRQRLWPGSRDRDQYARAVRASLALLPLRLLTELGDDLASSLARAARRPGSEFAVGRRPLRCDSSVLGEHVRGPIALTTRTSWQIPDTAKSGRHQANQRKSRTVDGHPSRLPIRDCHRICKAKGGQVNGK